MKLCARHGQFTPTLPARSSITWWIILQIFGQCAKSAANESAFFAPCQFRIFI